MHIHDWVAGAAESLDFLHVSYCFFNTLAGIIQFLLESQSAKENTVFDRLFVIKWLALF